MARRVPGARSVWDHPEHLRRYTEEELARQLEEAGFRVRRRLVPTFRPAAAGALVRWFWPPRTLVAECLAEGEPGSGRS